MALSGVIKAVGMKPGEVESLGRDRTVLVLTPSVVVTDRYQERNLVGAAEKAGVV